MGWCYEMPALYALTFGAMASAVDPTVVESLGANPDLSMNLLGESMLNNAVAKVGGCVG
jgi:NhaP-type Na+/H+ or K+/H+ antiporter